MNLTDYIKARGGTATTNCAVLTAIADKAGCAASTLYMVARGHKRAGWKLAADIEAATDGAVTRYGLRPDVFGPNDNNH